NQRRFPDHLEQGGFLGIGFLQAIHAFGIEGRHIHLFVCYRQGIDFVAAVDRTLENLVGVDIIFSKYVITWHQETGGGIGITIAEIQILGVLQHVLHGIDFAVLVGDQQAPVAWLAVFINSLINHFTVGTVHRFHGR